MHSISYRGHTLTWEQHSQGEQRLIFINGYSANRSIWTREVARMANRWGCISLDLPGHYPALTPPGYHALSQEELLDLELHAISQIAAGEQVTLIGHSTGGMVALAAAAMIPATVARVVAISPVVWGPLGGLLGFYQSQLRQVGGYPLYWLNYRATQIWLAYIKWGIGQFYSGDAAAFRRNPLVDAAVISWYPDYGRSDVRNFAILLSSLDHSDIRALIPQVACPTLVIAGVRDPVVPIVQARWLATQLADTSLLEVARAGHLPHWEDADRVDRAIDAWLEAHPV